MMSAEGRKRRGSFKGKVFCVGWVVLANKYGETVTPGSAQKGGREGGEFNNNKNCVSGCFWSVEGAVHESQRGLSPLIGNLRSMKAVFLRRFFI